MDVFLGLPPLFGSPIHFALRPGLTAYRGKLLSGANRGAPVHAGAFIRKRTVVLETDLLHHPHRLCLILTHELFHFAWVKLNNRQRRDFTGLLTEEICRGACGEAGESASVKKQLLLLRWPVSSQSPLWRDYLCESFCDSAAACFSGDPADEHFTLAPRWAKRRFEWLLRTGAQGWKC